jgi:hypothetical protein
VLVLARFGPAPDRGWLVAAVGVALTIVGWYEISGQPTTAQQLPYLASATIPGAALIVAGAVLVSARSRITETVPRAIVSSGGRSAGWWALPEGSYLHRPDCPLLDGKPEAYEIQPDHSSGGTVPTRLCPICEPEALEQPGPLEPSELNKSSAPVRPSEPDRPGDGSGPTDSADPTRPEAPDGAGPS